jgi:hypothetical protein
VNTQIKDKLSEEVFHAEFANGKKLGLDNALKIV